MIVKRVKIIWQSLESYRVDDSEGLVIHAGSAQYVGPVHQRIDNQVGIARTSGDFFLTQTDIIGRIGVERMELAVKLCEHIKTLTVVFGLF